MKGKHHGKLLQLYNSSTLSDDGQNPLLCVTQSSITANQFALLCSKITPNWCFPCWPVMEGPQHEQQVLYSVIFALSKH